MAISSVSSGHEDGPRCLPINKLNLKSENTAEGSVFFPLLYRAPSNNDAIKPDFDQHNYQRLYSR